MDKAYHPDYADLYCHCCSEYICKKSHYYNSYYLTYNYSNRKRVLILAKLARGMDLDQDMEDTDYDELEELEPEEDENGEEIYYCYYCANDKCIGRTKRY